MCLQDGMTCAHIAASTGSNAVMKELTKFNKTSISAKNKVINECLIRYIAVALLDDKNSITSSNFV